MKSQIPTQHGRSPSLPPALFLARRLFERLGDRAALAHDDGPKKLFARFGFEIRTVRQPPQKTTGDTRVTANDAPRQEIVDPLRDPGGIGRDRRAQRSRGTTPLS